MTDRTTASETAEDGISTSGKSPTLARAAPLALVALLFFLAFLFYRRIALTNLILVDYDLLAYFYPYKEAAASAIREGRLPLWNPHLFTGVPFLANPQTALFYPLNWPGYAFPAPLAVKYSVVFHVFLAGVFMYAFACCSLGVGKAGGMAAALSFMFGGFLTQQVGHINQLNAAAWLPLVLLLFDLAHQRRQPLFALLGGVALAAQILAGHSQETFLLLVALGLYALFRLARPAGPPMTDAGPVGVRGHPLRGVYWVALAFAIVLALGLGLSMAQLLPTLELSRESIRGGGLPYREAVSFSLPPWLLARSLLPSFQDSPFSEYIAYPGVVSLMLAACGLAGRRSRGPALFWLAVGALALFLALGGYNPAYELLYKLAPPLRLFRVPARWLYLCSFAVAALAGIGAHRLMAESVLRDLRRNLRSLALWVTVALIPVAAIQLAAVRMKEGVSPQVFLAWAGLVVLGASLVHLVPRLKSRQARGVLVVGILGGELLVAGSFLGSINVTAPQAYVSVRPTVSQLLQDPGLFRVLSIPRTDFDPGDLPELKAIFGKFLEKEELYQFVVAMKRQEALSPNIPMKYNISSLDGYDGGVLPLRRYVEFKGLLLDGASLRSTAATRPDQADALLIDQLAGIPDTRLLGLLNVKYIVIDKQADLWLDNVYYDLSAPVEVPPGAAFSTARLPGFQATALGIIYRLDGPEAPTGPLADVVLRDWSGGTIQRAITAEAARALPQPGSYFVRLELGTAATPTELSVRYVGTHGRLVLGGVALIDGRTGASETLTLDPRLRLAHSGDLKVYENLDWKPRAFVTADAAWAGDDREVLDLMRRSPGRLVLAGPPPPSLPVETATVSSRTGAVADIVEYRPEYVQVRAETPGPGYLVLTDSFYPGWRAYVDGVETSILRAQYLFRAVGLPAGSHLIEFRYEPGSFRWGLALSLTSLGATLAGAAWAWRR